ncbi:unnamed protein product [Protopolystoma xenopodis]|uniref:Uncharacterized protein n=1 Tax=Protopolystoma xenopodis TaxID=117903 RepID=A0A448XES4_9PLAT|nr:unnamed protein product [Protopolystoma xenopodis]
MDLSFGVLHKKAPECTGSHDFADNSILHDYTRKISISARRAQPVQTRLYIDLVRRRKTLHEKAAAAGRSTLSKLTPPRLAPFAHFSPIRVRRRLELQCSRKQLWHPQFTIEWQHCPVSDGANPQGTLHLHVQTE